MPIPRPTYPQMTQRVAGACYRTPNGQTEWYPPVMVHADMIARLATSRGLLERELQLLERLEGDAYSRFLQAFINDGLTRFGDDWRYADIVTALLAVAQLVKPSSYLEIGVRRGRSMAAVTSVVPDCAVVGIDMWQTNYAGMPNPGAEFVKSQLALVGHRGPAEFIDGNSHEVLPRLFAERPDLVFDMITVDGDHSLEGAAQDLRDVLPRLAIGGVIVFDDISHPLHPELLGLWREMVADDPRFSAWSFAGVGYGVGAAVRLY
ncbi:MAG TPA: class I SAM-dependent methyltransferase [Azospirillaceae bacterium]|nr:class I SAM-dependent methyltransferase [Azospirillaceae bacterium]